MAVAFAPASASALVGNVRSELPAVGCTRSLSPAVLVTLPCGTQPPLGRSVAHTCARYPLYWKCVCALILVPPLTITSLPIPHTHPSRHCFRRIAQPSLHCLFDDLPNRLVFGVSYQHMLQFNQRERGVFNRLWLQFNPPSAVMRLQMGMG